MRALFTAATGMEAQQVRIDSIANNIANVTTTGFKKSRAEFQDLFYETLKAPGAETAGGAALPTGAQIGHGVTLAAISRDFAQGERISTGNALDLAVQGEGFFELQKPGGESHYTRDGTFKRDRDGIMVDVQGYPLIPTITIPPDAEGITITSDGMVSAILPGSTDLVQVGQINLTRFANPSGLRAVGQNQFVPSDASGDPETGAPDENGFGGIKSGFLEGSNVNVAEELVQMILAQRAFEVNSRVIRAGDEMLQNAASLSR